jgi:hypothetical protein
MSTDHQQLPRMMDEQILELLLRGEAATLHDAEEMYLNAAIPEILDLLASSLSNEELSEEPILALILSHGSRGWEDSTL